MSKKQENHAFSVELKCKEHLKLAAISNNASSGVTIEGSIGELTSISFVENALLEIQGANGILRIDLNGDELRKALQPSAKEVKR
jgi:hypothetical protein